MASDISFEYLKDEINDILRLPYNEQQERIQNLGNHMIQEMSYAQLESLQSIATSQEETDSEVGIIQDLVDWVLNIKKESKENTH